MLKMGELPFYRKLITHHICPRHPGVTEYCSVWEVIKRPITTRFHRNLTSPGYSASNAFRLLKYHCPLYLSSPSIGCNPISLKVSFHCSLLEGDLGAPFELGLFTHRKLNTSNVLNEWVFNCRLNALSYFSFRI